MRIKYLGFFVVLLVLYNVYSQPSLKTPLELSGYTSLSGHQDMMTYLEGLTKSSPLLSLKIIGKSVEGRSLPALFFSTDQIFGSNRDKKPLVLIFCQQHGDERLATAGVLNQGQKRHGPRPDPVVVALQSFDQVLDRSSSDDREARARGIHASRASAAQLPNQFWDLVCPGPSSHL